MASKKQRNILIGSVLLPILILSGCSVSEGDKQAGLDRVVAVMKANESVWQFASGAGADANSPLGCLQIVSRAPMNGWPEDAKNCSALLTALEGKALAVMSVLDTVAETTNDEFVSDVREVMTPIALSGFSVNCEPSVAQELVTTGKSRCITALTEIVNPAAMLSLRNTWGSFYLQ